MFLRICDNSYCSTNLDIVVNALLTFAVIFLVLKRLQSIHCDLRADREAGDKGRECPCSPKRSSPIVPHDPGHSSQLQVQNSTPSLPDWWHLKAWALEKLPDISRPLNPSQILSPRPHLKFKETDAHAGIDHNVLPSFECGSSSKTNPVLPHEVRTLQQISAADSSKLELAKPAGPPSQDGRGWVLRKKKGWILAKKKPNAPSDQAESAAQSPKIASPADARARKKIPENVHVKSSLDFPNPAARSDAARKGKARDISALGFLSTTSNAQMRQKAAGSFTSPPTTSWAKRNTKPSGSSTSEKEENGSSSPRSSVDRRNKRENRTAEISGSGTSSRPSSSASTRPCTKQDVSSRSKDSFVLASSSTRVTRVSPRQGGSESVSHTEKEARRYDAPSSAFESCALDAHVQQCDLSGLPTPSNSEDFYSFPTSASSTSSKKAVTVDHSLRSGTGPSTPSTTDLRIFDGNLIHSRFFEQGAPATAEDAGGITEDEPQGSGLSRHSPRSSAESESHFLPLPATRSRMGSTSWSSQSPPPAEALYRSTNEPSDPATSTSPTSLHPALPPSSPHSAGQLMPNLEHGYIRSQIPNPGLLKSPCCQKFCVSPSRPTSSSGKPPSSTLPIHFSNLRTASVCSPAQFVDHDISVDNRLLISHTAYVAEGLLQYGENTKQPLSRSYSTSYPMRKPATTSLTRSGGTTQSNSISRTTEMPPGRRKNVWEPGVWPHPRQPRGCERYEKTARRRSRTHEGLPRLAAASVAKQRRHVGNRKVSFNQGGKRATKLREQQSTDAASRIYMEYAEQLHNSPAQPLPKSTIQGIKGTERLASSGGLQTASQGLAQLFYQQGHPYNASRGCPMNYQRLPTAVEGGEPVKPMLLDYQGYPVPPGNAMQSGSLPGTSLQYQFQVCRGAPCVDFHQQHAPCFTNSGGYPVASLVNNQGCAVAPTAISRVHPQAFFPNYRGYPSMPYQCSQEYTAVTSGNSRSYQVQVEASTTNSQAHPASSPNNFQGRPETCSINYRGIPASSSTSNQDQPPALSTTCIEDPTFSSSNRKSSKYSHIEEHEVLAASDTRNQNHGRTLSAFYNEHPNSSCETGIQLEGKSLSKRPLEDQDLKANSISIDDTLGVRILERLANSDVDNVELATHVPEQTSTPPSHSQLKTAAHVHPVPGDVVILFSGSLPSADREAT